MIVLDFEVSDDPIGTSLCIVLAKQKMKLVDCVLTKPARFENSETVMVAKFELACT